MLELAEAPCAHNPLDPGEERTVDPGCVLFLGASDHAWSNAVQRVRLDAARLAEEVERVRSILRARGRGAIVWEVSPASSPVDLAERLLELGMRPAEPPSATVMALDRPPRDGPADVVVERVTTHADFATHVRVTHEVFDKMDRLDEALDEIARDGDRKLAEPSFVRYTAFVDGRAVGAATATFTPHGAMLHSGCTLASYRGRGVYTAMVAARFRDAAEVGRPAVITRAGAMSRPILERHGFVELTTIRFFVDTFSPA